MSPLRRKLLRDLVHLRGQVIAVALVAACGVATVVATQGGYDSLWSSRASYYAEYQFADVFARLKRAPEAASVAISAIPGVETVQTRIVFEITLEVPGLDEPATGLLISVPERSRPRLNDIHVRQGRYVEPGGRREILVSEGFAEANGLRLGDSLGAVLNGRWEQLRIVGIALSPEFIYETRESQVFPDNRRFGVIWMGRQAMAPAFDMGGAFNDVVLGLAGDGIEEDVIARLDRLLTPYGGLGAIGRRNQSSHRWVEDELAQNRVTGRVLPVVFLGVAAFLLNIVLSRVVNTQREQIAVLKAFGYSDGTVGWHYLQFSLVAVVAGVVLGTAVGTWLGTVVNSAYANVYRFPELRYEPTLESVFLALCVSLLAAVIGASHAVRQALDLPPAEAMRPEAPMRFSAGPIDRFVVQRRIPVAARTIIRNLTRRPVRAILSMLAISFAVGILVVGRFFADAINHVADVQFRVVQRDDLTITFRDPLPARARNDVMTLPGVLAAESFRAVPVRLRFEHRTRRTNLLGLPLDSELRRTVDQDLQPVQIPVNGALLTSRLAEILSVEPGDILTVEVLEGTRRIVRLPVHGTVNELIGLSAYMRLQDLNRLMHEARTISGVMLKADPMATTALYRSLQRTPTVGVVTIREVALASFEATIAESLGILITVLVLFACVISFAVVYNTARIALSERGRELASLRILGFTRQEVAVMLLGEHAILTAIAVPIGCVIGLRISGLVADYYQLELFRIPLIVSSDTYVFSIAVTVAAMLFSGLVVWRRLERLDLVSVAKTRD